MLNACYRVSYQVTSKDSGSGSGSNSNWVQNRVPNTHVQSTCYEVLVKFWPGAKHNERLGYDSYYNLL